MSLEDTRRELRQKYKGISLKPEVVRKVTTAQRRSRPKAVEGTELVFDVPKVKRVSRRYLEAPEGLEERLAEAKRGRVGHCYFYENIVVFGDPKQLSKRMQSNLGEYLGKVYCLMPADPYYVLYEFLRDSKAYIKRRGGTIQRSMDRWAWPGKPIIVTASS